MDGVTYRISRYRLLLAFVFLRDSRDRLAEDVAWFVCGGARWFSALIQRRVMTADGGRSCLLDEVLLATDRRESCLLRARGCAGVSLVVVCGVILIRS